MDHDTGFAPHVSRGMCVLCGCKTTTVERWAQPGSWIIGIGGNRTGKRDSLVYALKVESTPSLGELRRKSPGLAAHLADWAPSSRVLVSRHFYYLGNNALPLPRSLQQLVVRTWGCKKVDGDAVARLVEYLTHCFGPGVYGTPNNSPDGVSRKCGCGRANKRLKLTGGKRASELRGSRPENMKN